MTSARDKTLQHLRRLASLAAAGVAMSGPACSSGYGVVDPLPPPPKCGDVANTISASAIVRALSDGYLGVELTFSPSSRAGVAYGKDAPTAFAARVVSSTPGADGSLVVVVTEVPPGYVHVTVPIDCPEGLAHVEARIEIPTGVVAGTVVKVTLSDSY